MTKIRNSGARLGGLAMLFAMGLVVGCGESDSQEDPFVDSSHTGGSKGTGGSGTAGTGGGTGGSMTGTGGTAGSATGGAGGAAPESDGAPSADVGTGGDSSDSSVGPTDARVDVVSRVDANEGDARAPDAKSDTDGGVPKDASLDSSVVADAKTDAADAKSDAHDAAADAKADAADAKADAKADAPDGYHDAAPDVRADASDAKSDAADAKHDAFDGHIEVVPWPGDTDPTALRSCVDSADLQRVLDAVGRPVRYNDPDFSRQELAARDVTNDLVVDGDDVNLVLAHMGECAPGSQPVCAVDGGCTDGGRDAH